MNTTHPHDPDLCRVCIQRPASTDGICDVCRPPWRTDEPTWNSRDLQAALRRWTWSDVQKALALGRALTTQTNAGSGVTMVSVSVAELLDQLAHDIPDLRQAACRGRAELFDADRHDREAIAQAKQVCASCPVLEACRAWLASLPTPSRPCGVVAGQYVRAPRPRTAYEPRPRRPSSRDRATAWLRAYLAQRGPVVSTQVIADATAAGINHSALYAARIELNVHLQRVPGGPGARHMWTR